MAQKARYLQFQGNNRAAIMSQAPILRIEGPAGTGKTLAILFKLHAMCELHPGCRVLIVRDTRTSLNATVIPSYLGLIGMGHPAHVNGNPEHIQQFRYPNGSTIALGGLDKPERIMGADYDFILVNEGTVGVGHGAVDLLLTRFRGKQRTPYRQLIIDMNPVHPSHWLNRWPESEDNVRIKTTHEDNPLLFQNGKWTKDGKDYLRALEAITDPAKLKRMRYGQWAASEGAIFNLDESNIVSISSLGNVYNTYPCIVGLDWGVADPFAAVLFAIDASRKAVYALAETYQPNLTTREQVLMVEAMLKTGRKVPHVPSQPATGQFAVTPRTIYYDPAMDNRGPRGADGAYGEPPIAKFRDRWTCLMPGDNRDRLQNLQFLQELVRNAREGQEGEWKLYIDPDGCPHFWEELEGASWRQDKRTSAWIEDTDDPDHAITAAYYALRPHLMGAGVQSDVSIPSTLKRVPF